MTPEDLKILDANAGNIWRHKTANYNWTYRKIAADKYEFGDCEKDGTLKHVSRGIAEEVWNHVNFVLNLAYGYQQINLSSEPINTSFEPSILVRWIENNT